MVRVFASLACAVALACVPARSGAAQLRYDAFQWFGVGEPALQGEAEVSQQADGSWAARLAISNAPEGRYLYRLVVPTRFYRRPPGSNLIPAGWVPVNVCIVESTGSRAGARSTTCPSATWKSSSSTPSSRSGRCRPTRATRWRSDGERLPCTSPSDRPPRGRVRRRARPRRRGKRGSLAGVAAIR